MTKQHHIPKPKATDLARRLRQDAPIPERLLWGMLRGRRLGGFKFRRQVPIGNYVVDYYCHDGKLVVELDGLIHVGSGKHDCLRQSHLEKQGLRVLRVTNDEVIHHREVVGDLILKAASERVSQPHIPSPQPSPEGRGGWR